MKPEKHAFWSNETESDEHVFGSDELRFRFLVVASINAVCLLAVIIGTCLMVVRGMTPPTILGYSHGLFFVSSPAPISSINWDTDLQQQFEDTVEVLFLRTEKGALPEINDFVVDGIMEQIDRTYRSVDQAKQSGFAQTLKIIEARVAPTSTPMTRRLHVMGILSSRAIEGSQSSTIYLQCDFTPGKDTDVNPTGWRLSGIEAIRDDQFFTEELERDRIRRLGLPG